MINKFLFPILAFLLIPLLLVAKSGSAHDHIDNINVTADIPDTVLRVTGNTFPNGFVTVLVDGAVVGTMTADGGGSFDKSFPSQTPGLHNIKIFAKDLASNTTTDTVSQNVSLQVQAETAVDFFLPTTIELSSTKVEQGDTMRFSGLTIPNGNVTLVLDNNLNLNAAADGAGKWNIDVSTEGFYIGTHSAFVVIHDGDGTQSPPSQKRLFSVVRPTPDIFIDETPPEQTPPQTTDGRLNTPIIDFPRNNQRFDSSPITIRGTGTPNTQIELYDGDELIGSAFINARGEWYITIDLTKDRYDLRLRSCSGNRCSDYSETVTIFYDGSLDPLKAELEQYRYFGVKPDEVIELNVDISGGSLPYEVVIDWGDDEVERITFLGDDNGLLLPKSYESAGLYSGVVTVRDSDNTTRTLAFSVEVKDPRMASWVVPVAIGVIASGIAAACTFVVTNKAARNTTISFFAAWRFKRKEDEEEDKLPEKPSKKSGKKT